MESNLKNTLIELLNQGLSFETAVLIILKEMDYESFYAFSKRFDDLKNARFLTCSNKLIKYQHFIENAKNVVKEDFFTTPVTSSYKLELLKKQLGELND